jgi:putative SOS response-associated peptidase YedK
MMESTLLDNAMTWTKLARQIGGGKPFALAGLWEWWGGPAATEGQSIESCSLITTDANKLASEIHDRMPVILDSKDYDASLDVASDDHEQLQAMPVPFSTKK